MCILLTEVNCRKHVLIRFLCLSVFTQDELDQLLDRSDLTKDRQTEAKTKEQLLQGVFRVID